MQNAEEKFPPNWNPLSNVTNRAMARRGEDASSPNVRRSAGESALLSAAVKNLLCSNVDDDDFEVKVK